jgi:hypothetical protein
MSLNHSTIEALRGRLHAPRHRLKTHHESLCRRPELMQVSACGPQPNKCRRSASHSCRGAEPPVMCDPQKEHLSPAVPMAPPVLHAVWQCGLMGRPTFLPRRSNPTMAVSLTHPPPTGTRQSSDAAREGADPSKARMLCRTCTFFSFFHLAKSHSVFVSSCAKYDEPSGAVPPGPAWWARLVSG